VDYSKEGSGTYSSGGYGIVIYGSNNCVVENCIAIRDTTSTKTYTGINVYMPSGYGNLANNNKVYGNIIFNGNQDEGALGCTSIGPNISGNIYKDNVVFNGVYGLHQSADDSLTVSNSTFVNSSAYGYYLHSYYAYYTFDAGFYESSTLKNSSFISGGIGVYIDPADPKYAGMTNPYNNYYNFTATYGGTTPTISNQKTINPSYATATYGNGAYLMVPSALQGQGEGGADIGAEVLYRYQDGVLTTQPLWPWPMEDRIFAETGVSPTWAANSGLWKTLDGVYAATQTPSADTTPPSVPGGLAATMISSSQINLSWTASTDNVGVAGYKVYRNGTQIATTATTSYSNTGLTASTTYSHTIAAYDSAGNTSAQSAPVSATTLAATDTTAPSVPTGLTATAASSSQTNLSWTASTDNVGVAGYRIYRGGTQIATTTGTTYSDTGLTASTTYTYTVAAYDAAGNTSAQSTAASATTTATTRSVSVSDACTATLSSDLVLHVPAATLNGSYLWGDATCKTGVNGKIYCRLTNYGAANPNDFGNCRAGLISSDLSTLHLPSVRYESQNYWGDLQFVPTTDDSIWLMVTAYRQI
jgi:chitodextrinase